MANWLEEEENKLAEEKKRIEDLKAIRDEKEALLNESLKEFFILCDRVNKVKYGLEISKFEVIGATTSLKGPNVCSQVGYRDHSVFYKLINRGIKFHLGSIEAFTVIQESLDSVFHRHKEFVLFRNLTTDQSIRNWEEEKIINLIRWLLFDLDNDTVIKYMPGEEEYNYHTQKNNLHNELNEAISKLTQCERWQLGRDSYDKYMNVNILKGKINDIKSEIESIEIHSMNK